MKAFEELIQNTKKRSYSEYVSDNMEKEDQQINLGVNYLNKMREKFREKAKVGFKSWKLGVISDEMLETGNEILSSGKVSAVDGTEMVPFNLIQGMFCQVGIGSINYAMKEPEIDVQSITSKISIDITPEELFMALIDRTKSREETKDVSQYDINAAMQYWELEHALELQTDWVMLDGPLIRSDMVQYDLGRELLKKLVEKKKICGIIKGSKSRYYRVLGSFLENKEYMIVENVLQFYEEGGFSQGRGLKDVERDFLEKYGTKILRGVYKAQNKFYLFEIHEDMFEEGISIIMADSLRNARGVPFLIDLIDGKLSAMFSNNVYQARMQNLLLSKKAFMDNIDERMLRSW